MSDWWVHGSPDVQGVWSTLPVNEKKLNAAFRAARSVVLVFSVRESGKFQGEKKSPMHYEVSFAVDSRTRVVAVVSRLCSFGVRVPSRRLSHPLGSSCRHECQDAGWSFQNRLAVQVIARSFLKAPRSSGPHTCLFTGGSFRSPRPLTCPTPGTNTSLSRSDGTARSARGLTWLTSSRPVCPLKRLCSNGCRPSQEIQSDVGAQLCSLFPLDESVDVQQVARRVRHKRRTPSETRPRGRPPQREPGRLANDQAPPAPCSSATEAPPTAGGRRWPGLACQRRALLSLWCWLLSLVVSSLEFSTGVRTRSASDVFG